MNSPVSSYHVLKEPVKQMEKSSDVSELGLVEHERGRPRGQEDSSLV